MAIQIAVIGAGVMGADHARIIAEDVPGARLALVCDASPERARAVADAYGGAETSTDPFAAIARNDIDAVIVASPDETHAPLCLAAIEASKPVLCEKPLSQSSQQCLDVIAAEVASGRQWVQVGFMRRYDPSYAAMKATLDSGELGQALMMHNFHRNVESPGPWFTGAMAITNSAPHEFDAARFVLEADYAAITAFQPARPGDLVAPVFMVLETVTGQIVNVEINNNAAYGYDVRGELVGEKGSVSLSGPIHARTHLGLKASEDYARDWRPRFAEAYRLQNKAFVHFARTGEFPAIAANVWDGYCATVVAEAGVTALKTGSRTVISLADKPALYARQET